MATIQSLVGLFPANTYKQVIQVGLNNIGLSASIQYIGDGSGTASVLGLSTTAVQINAANVTINGFTLSPTGNSVINGSVVGNMTGGGTLATGGFTLTVPATGTAALTSNKLSAFAATSSAELAGVISDETGSGSLVFANTPTFVTPVLGVATATSINKVALTAPATSATITIADGKTATISNTLTFTGTDSSSIAFGAGGTVAYTANNLSVFAATTSAQLAGVISDETGSGALVFANTPTLVTPVLGVATATSVNKVAITAPATSATLTISDGKTLSVTGTATISTTPITQVVKQTFTTNGTYTPTSGMVYCVIECIGAGGGGGGSANTSAGQEARGGGGGGGGYSKITATAATIGVSKAVTVSNTGGAGGITGNNAGTAGGDTSVGTVCVAKGGSGGGGNPGNASTTGGAGGIAGTGDLAFVGNGGEFGTFATIITFNGTGGNGAPGPFGGQPVGQNSAQANGTAGSAYGSGGNGGVSFNGGGTAAGGAGGPGFVLITEFVAV